MKVSPVKWLFALAIVGSAALSMAEATLTVGSPAPAIKVAKWLKGKPIPKFEPGKVYVMEFWATWCGPCKTSIPHLTELAKKYQGKATFTGVSVFEVPQPKDESYIPKVDKFVKDWGKKMDYNVAVDGKDGWMGANWMRAAEQPGIPTAFVVDQKGRVAWIGHPMDGLDEAVGQVIAGTYDIAAQQAKVAAEKAAEAKAKAESEPFLAPLRKGEYAKAVAELDKYLAANPDKAPQWAPTRFEALCAYDVPAAMAYAKELANTTFKDQPLMLNAFAWSIVDDKSTIKGGDMKVAVEIAEKGAAALKPGQDMEAAFMLDTLAYAYYKVGDLDKAMATQQKALAAAAKVKDFDPATKKEMEEHMALFKSKKG
jgi:thiol-disulfide isomerase/thioredoxin